MNCSKFVRRFTWISSFITQNVNSCPSVFSGPPVLSCNHGFTFIASLANVTNEIGEGEEQFRPHTVREPLRTVSSDVMILKIGSKFDWLVALKSIIFTTSFSVLIE